MNSINIRKVAAVAAGTAMLLGAAFAAVPGLTKDFVYDDNGSPNVSVVLGSGAQISDGIAAANLAAVIGSKAYVSTGGETTVTPDASGSVTVEVAGGQVTLPEASVRTDIGWPLTLTGLTLSTGQGLESGTVTYSQNEYDYEEEIIAATAANAITCAYAEGNAYHGIYFSNVKPNRIYYRMKFTAPFPIVGGNLASTVTIPFLQDLHEKGPALKKLI